MIAKSDYTPDLFAFSNHEVASTQYAQICKVAVYTLRQEMTASLLKKNGNKDAHTHETNPFLHHSQ